jgi:glycosyltransferase involved in cell wall biosynthesis
MSHATPSPLRLSIGILTKNESALIRRCIESASFADEIILLDSGSTDNTLDIARSLGVNIFVSEDWQGFAVQRNRLLERVTGDYIFFLDADEIITPELREEIETIVHSRAIGIWKVCWTVVAYGHVLKHFKSDSNMERLFTRHLIDHYEGVVHEGAIIKSDIPVARKILSHRLLHHSRQSIRASLEKLTQYAMLGAAKRYSAGQRGGIFRGFLSATGSFVKTYFLRGAILDGGPGFLYCLFVALESFFRYVALEYDKNHLTESIQR